MGWSGVDWSAANWNGMGRKGNKWSGVERTASGVEWVGMNGVELKD